MIHGTFPAIIKVTYLKNKELIPHGPRWNNNVVSQTTILKLKKQPSLFIIAIYNYIEILTVVTKTLKYRKFWPTDF